MDQVLYRREGTMEVVTLNRPESKNSFSFNMIKELGDHFQNLDTLPKISNSLS